MDEKLGKLARVILGLKKILQNHQLDQEAKDDLLWAINDLERKQTRRDFKNAKRCADNKSSIVSMRY